MKEKKVTHPYVILWFTALATPPTTVQCDGTSIACLTVFREISENSQSGRVGVGRGLGVMYSRRLLWHCKANGSVMHGTFSCAWLDLHT